MSTPHTNITPARQDQQSVVHNTQEVCAITLPDLEKIASGDALPDTIEEITGCLGALFRMSRLIVPVSSLLLAQARKMHFLRDVRAWVAWAKEHTGYDGSVLHHRRAIGDMLVAVLPRDKKTFRILASLPEDKLLCLTRLKPAEMQQFIAMHNVRAISRCAVRQAVSAWLGEPQPEDDQPLLPGFNKLIKAMEDIEPEELKTLVTDHTIAQKALVGGMSMLGAAVEFHKREKDFAVLEALQAALRDEADKIAAIMKG